MRKSFLSYVFRPHRVLLAALSLLGMLGSEKKGIWVLLFLGAVLNFICRSFSYCIDSKISNSKPDSREVP